MQLWRTTGNSNVAVNTDSMTDITTIPTWGFRPRQARRKCQVTITPNRSAQIAIWPPKPEIVILLELQQIASKLQRQIRDFRSCRAQMKCRQVIVTMTDNRKWQCGHQNRKYLYLWNCDMTILTSDLGALRKETDSGRLWQGPTTGNGNNDANVAIFGSQSLSQSFG